MNAMKTTLKATLIAEAEALEATVPGASPGPRERAGHILDSPDGQWWRRHGRERAEAEAWQGRRGDWTITMELVAAADAEGGAS